ncbi:iron ABC transporter ATP-binding protein [Aerococcus urinaehominis]|uniref:Iron ABC transporter ATP-binding protein n=1 Tax=Aerococcus urinaehominis TaxID=128944 RepID=A0A0X8FJX6_9LACT|nr:ATP-binding cassette domain-containing protein [Aerococcus urinaehominis]AMB98670.1 iron ABC transporter ATP-binding protein [Aerococcus urinaehominis]SDL97976.1 iron complex transport system ATP-binding protein [Aerococcus urinaehominis]
MIIKDLVKRYSEEVQIGPLNLEITNPGFTALVGPNGAGKSTLLLMVGRLLDFDQGQVSVGGLDIKTTPSHILAKKIAILRQENHFMTRLTVRQLLAFGRFPYSQGRITEEDQAIINKYLNFFNLSKLQDRYLDQLSGGQRQRAYVAMVLCQETDYILLDEPLNNLDIASSVQMMNLLREAVDIFDRRIIAVLHDINVAAQYADSIVAMKEGQIIAYGSAEEIMQADILTNIFDAHIQTVDSPMGKIAVY